VDFLDSLCHLIEFSIKQLTELLQFWLPLYRRPDQKRTHAKRLERLRVEGISDEDLARIRAPVGLSIGAKGPAEIAVSNFSRNY
jgi:xanthine dehydrogenase accessory factor